MIRAAGDMGTSIIRDLTVAIIRDGKAPSDWEQSFIVCLYKGKGDALERGNYRGLKLTEQVMKILERIVDSLIRQLVSIDNSQFGFVPGRGTTDAIFVVRQLQEKYLAANKRLYMAFVDLEKAFDQVPWKVIWWALRKLGLEESIVRLVQGMYTNELSCVRVGEGYSEEFEVKVGVHQGSVLRPLLFIIVLEALSREFRSGVPWEDLYADDLVITWGMCQEALELERSNGEERTESKCRKDKDHDLRYGTGPHAEFRRVSMRRLSHWSGQQQHLLQWLQALGAQEMQWAQAHEKWPWLQMYKVPGNCTPLGWQTTEGSPGQTWQAWGGSFLLLPRRHALSSRWLWTLNHNTWENSLEEVQGPATSSLFKPPLFQKRWPCVQLLLWSTMLHASETWPLTKPNLSVSSDMTGQWSDRFAMSDCKTSSPPGPMSYLCGLALRIWTSFWRREDSNGMDMWNAPMVQ